MIVQSILDQIIMQKWSLNIEMMFIASLLILSVIVVEPQDPESRIVSRDCSQNYCNLTWQPYSTYRIWVSIPHFVLLTLDDSWRNPFGNNPYAIHISYNDMIEKYFQVNYSLYVEDGRFSKYHYIGPVGMFFMTTHEVLDQDAPINITYENYSSIFENTDIFTKIIVNESYGTVHGIDINPTVFYHPNAIFDKENECDMENTTNYEFAINMRTSFNFYPPNLRRIELYSRFLIFDGFGTNMTYLGSILDLFITLTADDSGIHQIQREVVAKSGILTIYFVGYDPKKDNSTDYDDVTSLISSAEGFQNDTQFSFNVFLSDTTYYAGLLSSGVYYMLQMCDDYYLGISSCQTTFSPIEVYGNVSILPGCSSRINDGMQDFHGGFFNGGYASNLYYNVRVRGKCWTLYLKDGESNVKFHTSLDYSPLEEGEYVITTYNYPYPANTLPEINDTTTTDILYNSEKMFEITYETYHYEVGIDCLNVTFMDSIYGTSDDSTCGENGFHPNGSSISRGIKIQMLPGEHSTGMLIRLTVANPGNYTVPPSTSPTTTNNRDKTKTILIATFSSLIGVLIIIIIIGIICYCNQKRIPFLRNFGERSANFNEYSIYAPGSRDPWVVKSTEVEINEDRQLGKGAFSEVFYGVLKGEVPLFHINQSIEVQLYSNRNTTAYEVAVKRLLGHASDRDRMDFFKEIEIMKQLEFSPHIVCMYGYVASKFFPLVLLEYCELGDVLHYVTDNSEHLMSSPNSIKELTSYAWQICDGMLYISLKDIVHRDLAARNVLLTKSKVAKICDFGLAIYSDETINPMQKGLLPLKWLSPECYTENSFSTKSDVWSFGITLFEIYSLGQLPYRHVTNSDLLKYLQDGNRLLQPELCPDEIYEVMKQCWCLNASDRLTFDELKTEISKCLVVHTGTYGYIALSEETET